MRSVRPHAPEDPGALLRRLGAPPGLEKASDELQAAVSAAADVAWELLAPAGDPIIAMLQEHGTTSARALAERLGEPIEAIRGQLRRRRRGGVVSVAGRGPATRYHLSR